MLTQIAVSFLASLGFGIIFNIKGKNLIFASIGGAISWFSYLYLKEKLCRRYLVIVYIFNTI